MQKYTRMLAVLLLLAVLLTGLPVPEALAASSGNLETQYKQKVVAVVFDDSGSMNSENRFPAARYALSMLASMLDDRDEMYVIPMNQGPSKGYPVNLGASSRTAEIDNILKKLAVANGSTPSDSMDKAIDVLTGAGLKDKDHLIDSDPNKEYWMVILTDGAFEDETSANKQARKVKLRIDPYPTLHTVYVSFGAGAIDISQEDALKDYPLLSMHCKVSVDKLVEKMQEIANTISGRYPLETGKAQYEVDGKTVRVNLSQMPFSLSALSVIAQNCGATIQSVKYESADMEGVLPKPSLSNVCIVKPDSELTMEDGTPLKQGCAFNVESDRYMQGGTLVLEFSDNVDIDRLSVFATPALHVSYYFEAMQDGSWQRVDAQYINANLKKGDQIRVKYEVLDQITGDPVDLKSTFGAVEAKIVYDQKVYDTGDPVSLVVGTHELTVEVSVNQGAYTLRDSEILTVEEDPTFFRIEVQGDDEVVGVAPTANAYFTVYVDNVPASRNTLQGYACTLTATAPSGDVIFRKTVTPGADGRIAASLPIENNAFGVYTMTLDVKSPTNMSRSCTYEVAYAPDKLVITQEGSDRLSVTQYNLISNTEGFTFLLTANGQAFPFDNPLTTYKLTVDGVDMTGSVSVSGNTLTFVPTESNLGSITNSPGDKEILLTLESTSRPSLNTTAAATLTVVKTNFTVVPLTTDNNRIDRFDLKNCTASLAFSVERDGVPLSFEELAAVYGSGKIQIETTPLFSFPLFPAGVTCDVETVNGTGAVVVRAVRDLGDYLDWHCAAFITGGEKTVTVNYLGAVGEDAFLVTPSSLFQHIFRITVLLLEILLVIYILAYLVGFFIAKPLPQGVFIRIKFLGGSVSERLFYVNDTRMKYVMWHLSRLNPLVMWKNQMPDDQAPDGCKGISLMQGEHQSIMMEVSTAGKIFALSPGDGTTKVLQDFHQSIPTHPLRLNKLLEREGIPAEFLFKKAFPVVAIPENTTADLASLKYYGYFEMDAAGIVKIKYAICFYPVDF